MRTKQHTANSFNSIKWSGGLTTELFIFPEDSEYAKKNFDFRISTATVEVEESLFTPLPNVTRTLLVLSGEMRLNHKDHHSVTLRSGDVDRFEGGWETASYGKCTDFNLMTMGNTSGSLSAWNLNENQQLNIPIANGSDIVFLFLNSGELQVIFENEKYTLNRGDLLAISGFTDSAFTALGNASSQLVVCSIEQ